MVNDVEPNRQLRTRHHAVFIHIATLGRYQEILDELAAHLVQAEMCRTASRIVLGVVGDGAVRFSLDGIPVRVERWCNDVAAFEHPTLAAIQQYCLQNPNAAVLYLNCLGGRHVGVGWSARSSWRAMLMHLFVERYATCLKTLEGRDVLGVTFLPDPLPHMTSNNWWCNASYVSKLASPIEFRQSMVHVDLSRFGQSWCDAASKERHSAEFWIGSGPGVRAVSAFDVRRVGLPCNWLGSVPWWGVAGVDWLQLARWYTGQAVPVASRFRHLAIVGREWVKHLVRVVRKALVVAFRKLVANPLT